MANTQSILHQGQSVVGVGADRQTCTSSLFSFFRWNLSLKGVYKDCAKILSRFILNM